MDAYIIVDFPSELKIENKNQLTRSCHQYQKDWIKGFPYVYPSCKYDEAKH